MKMQNKTYYGKYLDHHLADSLARMLFMLDKLNFNITINPLPIVVLQKLLRYMENK